MTYQGASLTIIRDCLFEDNRVSGFAEGGALIVSQRSGAVAIVDSVFRRNSCQNNGGAIEAYQNAGALAIRGCTFLANTAAMSPPERCLVAEQSNDAMGGALDLNNNVESVVGNCSFMSNSACVRCPLAPAAIASMRLATVQGRSAVSV